jgi:FkbM family methyltransferase
MEFHQMIEFVRQFSPDEMFSRAVSNKDAQVEVYKPDDFSNLGLGFRLKFVLKKHLYRTFKRFGFKMIKHGSSIKGYTGKRFTSFMDSLRDLKVNYIHYEWLYGRMSDDRSREVLALQLEFRLTTDFGALRKMTDKDIPQYFDKSIVSVDENEVFVDCGGFTGDTVQSYIDTFGEKFKRIYTYEPSPINNEQCRENLKAFQNVVIRPFGVGDVSTTGKMSMNSSGSAFTNSGSEEIGIVSLDEDITEPVTFIKMDIEGFEEKALWGARRHISEESPKLAICLYHYLSDIWELPLIINAINPNYDFYMRHYYDKINWETVLYCIPKK